MEEVDGKSVYVEPVAENETTLTIRRKTVDPEFLFTVTDLLIYPKHIVSKYEGDVKAFTQAPELNNLSYTGNLGRIDTRNGYAMTRSLWSEILIIIWENKMVSRILKNM